MMYLLVYCYQWRIRGWKNRECKFTGAAADTARQGRAGYQQLTQQGKVGQGTSRKGRAGYQQLTQLGKVGQGTSS